MKEYKFRINGNEYNVAINGIENSVADVTVNGKSYSVELAGTDAPVAEAAPARVETVKKEAPDAAAPGRKVCSPLPGVIIEISVKEGQAVKRGQKIAVLEAMKMENDILAPQDGTISEIHASKGDSVLEGALIAVIG